MLKNLIHTLGSRFLISLFNLALLFITTKLMGAENKGEISLLVLNLSIAAIVSGLFGGPALVYLIPRFPLRTLITLNYSWALVTSFILMAVTMVGALPSTVIGWELFLLALMESLIAANTMILLGQERVRDHNFTQVIKVTLTVAILLILQFQGKQLDLRSFVEAYRIGLFAALFFSVIRMRGTKSALSRDESIYHTLQTSMRLGGLVQLGNVAQLLNYRLSFYFLEILIHPPEKAFIRIGIYSASLQVAEAVWQFARSVSTVQYAKVSNLKDPKEGLRISLSLSRLNLMVTVLGIALLAVLPSSFYERAFGSEFGEVQAHVILLAPGIIALSMSNAFSHFYAGIGEHRVNTISSIIGLILTIAIGYPSIVYFGTAGAAVTATVVYILQTIYQWVVLVRRHNAAFADLLPGKEDIVLLKGVWNRLRP